MPTARELFVTFLLALLLALFVRTFLVRAFQIPSASMAPGLVAGDYILVNRFIYSREGRSPGAASSGSARLLPMRTVRRGDVVVFRHPREPWTDLVKRAAGLPGDRVEIRARRLHIDGRPIPESGYRHPRGPVNLALGRVDAFFGPVVVPLGEYFFLGDHRRHSRDSRSWGAVPGHRLQGRAVMIYWSVAPERDVADDGSRWDRISRAVWSPVRWISRVRWGRSFKLVR